MFRVAIIINENEVSHSKYADTLNTLKSAISTCNENGGKMNSYNFITFDRFNIHTLFEQGGNHIMTFNGIVIATNAMHNTEIFDAFCQNKQDVENFINSNKGVFISSQKKLSNRDLTLPPDEKKTGFMPELYNYYLFDRSEKSSADGKISICSKNEAHRILTYPNKITNSIIENHCENNTFQVHRYRSVIIPQNLDAFTTLLHDSESEKISNEALGYEESDRKLLLVSHYNKRIVISTMALDWANHSELLSNILTFITEDKPPVVFVKKATQQVPESSIIDSYIIRANASNIPYRVIAEVADYSTIIGNVLIFSSDWESSEIENIYNSMLQNKNVYFSIYHICGTDTSSNIKLCKYSNFSSIDIMKDIVIQNIFSGYLITQWNKSIWTYSYIINLTNFFEWNVPEIIKKIYEELSLHFTKNKQLTGDYDNVVNATCKLLEILFSLKEHYNNHLFEKPFSIDEVIQSANEWLVKKINNEEVVDQDICYCLLYFIKNDRYNSLDNVTQQHIITLLQRLILNVLGETLTSDIENRSSIDLCRIYQTLCLLPKEIELEKNETYINTIEAILKGRQDGYGNWKNISETAEISGILLDVYDARLAINNGISTINILIARGIEVLYSQFDAKTNMWSNDLNTTAKAMYAISLYNKRFNFSINDFFGELYNKETKDTISDKINPNGINGLYKEIYDLNKKEKLLKIKNTRALLIEKYLFYPLCSVFFFTTYLCIEHNGFFYEVFSEWKKDLIIPAVIAAIPFIIRFMVNKYLKKEK